MKTCLHAGTLPTAVVLLASLRELHLEGHDGLAALPLVFSQLSRLTAHRCAACSIHKLGWTLGQLQCLKELEFTCNTVSLLNSSLNVESKPQLLSILLSAAYTVCTAACHRGDC